MMGPMNVSDLGTQSREYSNRIAKTARWKKWLRVQAPYRWNLQRLDLGWTAEVGCGVGRNLLHLDHNAVGIDHNPHSVAVARERGCEAFTPEEFRASEYARPESFDSLLFAHVLEHMSFTEARSLVEEYLIYLRPEGRVLIITPQEAGFRSDDTHVELMDFAKLHDLLTICRLVPAKTYSFPFPRFVGRFFRYNEFVVLGRKPDR